MEWLKEEFQRQHRRDLPIEENASLCALLRAKAEQAKIALSSASEVPIAIPRVLTIDEQCFDLNATLSRTTFEERIQPLIDRSLAICTEVLKKAHIDAQEIDQVLLVGGQTRTPAIQAAIEQRFGWKLNTSVNPDEAVAQGAAILGYVGISKNRLACGM